MNKRIKKIITVLVFFILVILYGKVSNAAYITINGNGNAKPGETLTFSINSDCVGRVNLSAKNGTLSSSSVWIEGGSQTVSLKVANIGNASISASAEGGEMSNNGVDVAVPSVLKNISINSSSSSQTKESSTNNTSGKTTSNSKSNVATLGNLGIKPNDFSGFNANKTSYSVEVPNTVEKIEVYASIGQSGQTITGTGIKTLKEGSNSFDVTVTAEDGVTKKTYTVNVTRKAKDDEEDEKEEEKVEEEKQDEKQEEFGLKSLTIEGLNLQPQFQSDIYEYKIQLKEDLEKLDLSTLATDEDADIEITGNENLQEGENIITILVKSKDEQKTIAYQIIVNKVLNAEEDINNQEQQEKIIIIAAIVGTVLFIIVILIIIFVKKRKKTDDSLNPYYNLLENPDLDETDNLYQEDDVQDNNYEAEPRRKRHSKGKRFK